MIINTRFYKTIPLTNQGYQTETQELDPHRTALVVLHCWDIGCEGGPEIDPDYFVGMGTYESFNEAARIMKEAIRPAMDAARAAGITVCHVEHVDIWHKHPSCRKELDPPAGRRRHSYAPDPVVPGWRRRIAERSHGIDYATSLPYSVMDRATIVAPEPDEPVVLQTNQFDRVLRNRGIENLIYSGFSADMCLLRADGGVEPMAGHGYRLFLLRDGTTGIEFPDTVDEQIATRWAIRYFETHYGNTLTSTDFIQACNSLTH